MAKTSPVGLFINFFGKGIIIIIYSEWFDFLFFLSKGILDKQIP